MNQPLITQLSSVIESRSQDDTIIDLPESAPFDLEQRQWLNGLLTGISTIAAAAQAGPEEEAPGTPLSVFYGSQSGNCEVLAKELKKYSATQGFEASIDELDSTSLEEMASLNHALIVCSTFGDGEPTDNAKNFYTSIMAEDAPPLPASLNFSVCGLGDSSYAQFNKCATDIYSRMIELGATPCRDLIACDVAFEDDFATWKNEVFETDVFKTAAGASSTMIPADDGDEPVYTKNTPFLANLIASENLSGEGSAKRVNHIEISLAGAGEDMNYEV
ncbi:MAG: flavodoxin domain-containing protein, partial [Pseudomonadota bacterium]